MQSSFGKCAQCHVWLVQEGLPVFYPLGDISLVSAPPEEQAVQDIDEQPAEDAGTPKEKNQHLMKMLKSKTEMLLARQCACSPASTGEGSWRRPAAYTPSYACSARAPRALPLPRRTGSSRWPRTLPSESSLLRPAPFPCCCGCCRAAPRNCRRRPPPRSQSSGS
jgi:hypothetical protein